MRVVLNLLHRHVGVSGENLCQRTRMIGSKVLDDNEGNAGICRHGFEKPFKGL